MKNTWLIITIILGLTSAILVYLGISHIGQSIRDISLQTTQRNAITYIGLFGEIPLGAILGVLGFLSFSKYRNYED